MNHKLSPVLYIPHGGGPLPLFNDDDHLELITFLGEITQKLRPKPSAILVLSAHWEEKEISITSGPKPGLIYDYSGFPKAAYSVDYPAPGHPKLALKIFNMLQTAGFDAKLDRDRGFDHGLFVPLKLMYPDASIPCVQMSLLNHLDPGIHIRIGRALSELRHENILILGSGLSFHNMRGFFNQNPGAVDPQNEAFQTWLADICTDTKLSEADRENHLAHWEATPGARYCHPREEHLLPLHVCYGIAGSAAKQVFDGRVLNKQTSAFLWGQ